MGGGGSVGSLRGSTVWTGKNPAEDTPGRECPHDVVGLRPHKGTMWMSNDRVPLENVESPYGGGVSSLPGAAGDLLPVMFPVAHVLLAGGPQLGSWQVAVVRVDETPAGDSSGREYPCTEQNRHRPIDIYELPDGFGHTVVEGGPVGPEVIEPLELLVLDHADPDGQHAVIQDTARLLEHPLTLPDWSRRSRTGSRRHVRFRTLSWTVDLGRGILTWSIRLRGSLDSGLMEGMLCLESLEQSVLGALSVVRPDETNTPERPALASQMNHKRSRFKSSAWPMLDFCYFAFPLGPLHFGAHDQD